MCRSRNGYGDDWYGKECRRYDVKKSRMAATTVEESAYGISDGVWKRKLKTEV
jgi:hypothetical protein